MATPRRAPRVLLTNDDGPPSSVDGASPFIYRFALALKEQLGWDVHCVVPAGQQSWKGKSYAIAQITTGKYYVPAGVDGTEGVITELPTHAPNEWILIDSTPATCANLGLHSLFPPHSFDLVIAGPNYGRNTGSAFALSSGTIGSALAGAMSVPAIALSFGLMTGYKPPPVDIVEAGIRESCKVMQQLWNLGWGSVETGDRVDVYSVNVPLQPEILNPAGATVEWTTLSRTQYGRLFKSISRPPPPVVDPAGPAAIPESIDENARLPGETGEEKDAEELRVIASHETAPLKFAFAPDLASLINPTNASLQPGTDSHALHLGHISVCPIVGAYAAAVAPEFKWRL